MASRAPQPPTSAGPGVFVTTHWSVVLAAGHGDTPRAREALAQLCETYWYPLYAYVRRRGYAPPDAQDLTQAFFARLLERKRLSGITREGGKFRSFLLTAMNHFLVDEWKRSSARKRGGPPILPWETDSAESRYQREPVETLTPEKVFEQNWALALLDSVCRRLEQEYEANGKGDLFAHLKFCLTGDRSDLSYGELAGRLGMAEGAVKVAAHRLRQRYRQLLRAEIAQTVSRPDEVEEELRYLLQVLSV